MTLVLALFILYCADTFKNSIPALKFFLFSLSANIASGSLYLYENLVPGSFYCSILQVISGSDEVTLIYTLFMF